MNTVELSRVPRGRTRKTTSWPLLVCDSMRRKSSSLFTGCLLISRIDVAAAQSGSIAEAIGLNILNNHALGIRQLITVRQILRDAVDDDAELALLGLAFLALRFLAAQTSANSLARSAMVTSDRLPPCRRECSRSSRCVPGFSAEISATSSSPFFTGLPLTETMVSPVLRPAFSAGPFG